MVTATEVSKALRSAGHRVRTGATSTIRAPRVYEDGDRVKVHVDYGKPGFAVLMAEWLADELRKAGYVVEAEEHKAFFHVVSKTEALLPKERA
jgi:hypothetical protein